MTAERFELRHEMFHDARVPHRAVSRMSTVANTVRTHREARGTTQEELARAVGVTRQTIIAIERGNYTPSVELALSLARYFRVPVETLFSLSS